MKVTFYGVRGSIPAPGPEFVRFGGNTACVHVELNDGTDIILDAGTGIKKLGETLMAKKGDIHLLLSHNHWDHIQGFPFFMPIYQNGRNIFITPGMTSPEEPDAVIQQMSGSRFPVSFGDLSANIKIIDIDKATCSWRIGSAVISRYLMNHPGKGSAYLIQADGAKLAYITDNELYPPYKEDTHFQEWVTFAEHADLLIHDAQYIGADMPSKSGWGHSVADEAVKLAMAAKAKRLALYSHDHFRTDDEVEAIEKHCRSVVMAGQMPLSLFAAFEGQCLDFDKL
ncbi:MBL fold metallo-hydrolase [Aliiglaciecola sp. CAU 1673]|uniref:MBL fold metallo-hydrolase n=1 Tax=Aliiglaciecola sp. CAU 1673 TaxID=3032595 RepID=UPI0023DBF363|nr:MBL fold metallo-hydrolase [Aliiglaciecola sp. CAU 1673]MDF2179604.1 MBL fold metallo-hydrolase [Aliiglaciecola sp. CAU 1673]